MAYEYQAKNGSCIEVVNMMAGSKELSKPMVDELDEVYRKAKAWDNYIAEVRERVRFTERTEEDIEKHTQDVIDYYMEEQND